MDLRRLLAIARPWLPLVIGCVVLAAGAAYVLSGLQAKVYQSEARLIVGQSLSAANPDYNQLLVSQRLSSTYAEVATTRPVLEKAISQLGLQVSADELVQHVQASAQPDSTLLSITAQDTDPALAASIANAVANELVAVSPAIQGREVEFQNSIDAELTATQQQIDATQAQAEALANLTERTAAQDAELATLENRLASLRATYATLLGFSSNGASNLLKVIEPAVASDVPISPRPLLNTLLAAALGLMLAVGIATAVTYARDAIRDADDIQELVGLPTLAAVSRMRGNRDGGEMYRLTALLYPRSKSAEAYRTLRANVEFAMVDAPLQVLLVTGSIASEGKTVTAANLAVAFSQAGQHVLLVDADLRKPGIHAMFNLTNTQGLTTMLRDPATALEDVLQTTDQESLSLLSTGPLPPNPAELLGSHRMQTVLERLKQRFDVIVLDSPPVLLVTDAAVLSSLADATVLVVDAGRSRRRELRRSRAALDRAGANVLGAVLNRVHDDADLGYGRYFGTDESDLAVDASARTAEASRDQPAS